MKVRHFMGYTYHAMYLLALLIALASRLAAASSWNPAPYDSLYGMVARRAVARRIPELPVTVSYLRAYRQQMASRCAGQEYQSAKSFGRFLDGSVSTIVQTIQSRGITSLPLDYLITTVRLADRYLREKGRQQNTQSQGQMYGADWQLVAGLREGTQRLSDYLGRGEIDFDPGSSASKAEDGRDERSAQIAEAEDQLREPTERACLTGDTGML